MIAFDERRTASHELRLTGLTVRSPGRVPDPRAAASPRDQIERSAHHSSEDDSSPTLGDPMTAPQHRETQ
jgi:hypothetical protein